MSAAATQEPKAVLATLVGFDTTSAPSNLPPVDRVEDFAGAQGATVEGVPDETGRRPRSGSASAPPTGRAR
ncbi:hypothetical protein ACFQ12_02405, partial [Methylobacterium trifolii]